MTHKLGRRHFLQAGVWIAGLTVYSPHPLWARPGQKEETRAQPGEVSPNLTSLQEKLLLAMQHEHGAVIQYVNHCGKLSAQGVAVYSQKVGPIIADEVEHARILAEILCTQGVEPTLAVWPPQTAGSAFGMLKQDVAAEKGAVALYDDILREKIPPDIADRIEPILKQEIRHRQIFSDLNRKL